MEEFNQKAHWSFWLISILMLIWNFLGSVNFLVQLLNPDLIASYREIEQQIILTRPVWATIGFAVAVFGGTLGCVLLMLKSPNANYLLIFSLIGVIITLAHTLTINMETFSAEMIGTVFMPLSVSAFLVWYGIFSVNKGWLKA